MSLNQIDGLPIKDSKKSIKITVNNNDINKADPKQPDDCAIARACRRELHVKEVRVHLSRVYLRSNEGNWVRYLTSRALRSEIIAFDRGGAFAAGEYDLIKITPTKALGKRRGGNKPQPKKNSTGKKRRKAHVVTDVRAGVA